MVGYYGLRALGSVAFKDDLISDKRYGPLFEAAAAVPQFVFVGGKGGVGKTSTSAALAVRVRVLCVCAQTLLLSLSLFLRFSRACILSAALTRTRAHTYASCSRAKRCFPV